MTFDFTCQACDGSFELELSDLLEETAVECPSCEARAPRAVVEGVLSAFDDLFSQLATLRRSFTVAFQVESDDLPTPYDREGQRPSSDDDEEEDDSEGDEDGWEAEEEAAEDDDDER
jgi:hypothetical protein